MNDFEENQVVVEKNRVRNTKVTKKTIIERVNTHIIRVNKQNTATTDNILQDEEDFVQNKNSDRTVKQKSRPTVPIKETINELYFEDEENNNTNNLNQVTRIKNTASDPYIKGVIKNSIENEDIVEYKDTNIFINEETSHRKVDNKQTKDKRQAELDDKVLEDP